MKTRYKHFLISSKHQGSKIAPWNTGDRHADRGYTEHNVVSIRNTETGKSIKFDLWLALNQSDVQSEKELLGYFENFLSDAIAGTMDYTEFKGDFGYEDDKMGRKIWKGCGKFTALAEKLDIDDLYALAGELRDYEENWDEHIHSQNVDELLEGMTIKKAR